jgi:hypothetical protein
MSDIEINTEETLSALPSKNKGKGKAIPTKHDKEHLPWYFRFTVTYLKCNLHVDLNAKFNSGWRNIDHILYQILYRSSILLQRVSCAF